MTAAILPFTGVRFERHATSPQSFAHQGDPGDATPSPSPRRPLIIGLCGLIGAGKTTAAMHMVTHHGFQRLRFADPLKRMLANLLDTMGVPSREAARMIDGDLKETPCPLLQGRSPRHAMQTLGAEWGRGLIGQDLWIEAWRAAASVALAETPAPHIVADDCRYPNELAAIRALGGFTIWIDRPGLTPAAHESERSIGPDDCDFRVDNSGPIERIGAAVWMASLSRTGLSG